MLCIHLIFLLFFWSQLFVGGERNNLNLQIYLNGELSTVPIPSTGNEIYSSVQMLVEEKPELLHMQGPVQSDSMSKVTSFLCFSMMIRLCEDINNALTIAFEHKSTREVDDAIEYASQANLNIDVCGDDVETKQKVAVVLVNSYLRPLLKNYEWRGHEKVLGAKFLELLEYALNLSIEYNIEPYDDLENGVQLHTRFHKQSFEYFEKSTYGELTKQLTSQMEGKAREIGEVTEGGLFTPDGRWSLSLPSPFKRECYSSTLLHAAAKYGNNFNAMEVGFNAGHSAAMFLTLLPEGTLTGFDLCFHSYTIPAAHLIGEKFPGRFSLVCGDSQLTLWERVKAVSQGDISLPLFHFSFIDGYHTYDVTLSDLKAAKLLSHQNATVVLDDCQDPNVSSAWWDLVDAGEIVPLNQGVCWRGLCIGTWS